MVEGMDAARHKQLVGARLRQAIKAVDATQSEVARALGISPSKLGNWLRGDNYPDIMALVRLRNRYGITLDWVLAGAVAGLPKGVADCLPAAAKADAAG